jgi:hypothetical protein
VFHFWAEILPNFHLENLILTYTKDFAWEKNGSNWPDFGEKKKEFLDCQIFMISSSR